MAQFADIEGEADRFEQAAWERGSSALSSGEGDLGDVAEWAQDEAVAHFMMLSDLRKQVVLASLAGMFHQWDKDLREFIDMELHHDIKSDWIDDNVWPASTAKIFELIEQFGWKVTGCRFHGLIEACGLIVNVYKHGKGRSLKLLHSKYPQYLSRFGFESLFGKTFVDHRWVNVTDQQFEKFAEAFDDFWSQMPERSYYAGPN